jgi:hypothetical protein
MQFRPRFPRKHYVAGYHKFLRDCGAARNAEQLRYAAFVYRVILRQTIVLAMADDKHIQFTCRKHRFPDKCGAYYRDPIVGQRRRTGIF